MRARTRKRKLPRRERISAALDGRIENTELAAERIRGNTALPAPVREYLAKLVLTSPTLTGFTNNTFVRTIPKILRSENLADRVPLDDFLSGRARLFFGPPFITEKEKARYRRELTQNGFFSGKEVDRIMADIEARPALSETGAHGIVHYALCCKVLDRIAKHT